MMAMFSRTLRLNSRFSCSTTPIWRLQLRRVDQADVDAVDQDAALLHAVQALDQLGQRALARARASDDADNFPGAYVQARAPAAPAPPPGGSET